MCDISVIVPVYNLQDYIARCIQSVLSQSFDNFELILVDDGSTDDSLSILYQYEQKDSRVKVFSQKNSGVSVARNLGIQMSCGDYITFIDGDDWVDKYYLDTMFSEIQKNNADVCCVGLQEIKEDEELTFQKSSVVKVYPGTEMLVRGVLFQGTDETITQAGGKLIRSTIAKSVRFLTGCSIGEDHDFMTQCYCLSDSAIIIEDKLYFYFFRRSSSSRSGLSKSSFDCFDAYEHILDLFKKKKLNPHYSWILGIYAKRLIRYKNIILSSCNLDNTEKNKLKKEWDKRYQRLGELTNGLMRDEDSNESYQMLFDIMLDSTCSVIDALSDTNHVLLEAFSDMVVINTQNVIVNTDNTQDWYPYLLNYLKKVLKMIKRVEGKGIDDYSPAYSLAYPKFSQLYWIAHGIKEKVKHLGQ